MRLLHRSFRHTPLILALGCGLTLSHSAGAQIITDLFNTGVDSSKAKLAPSGVADTHYINITPPAGTTFTATNSAWHNYSDAGFISINPTGGVGNYTVTFDTTFTLPTNVDVNTVSIRGNYSVDNDLTDILINGHSTLISDGTLDVASHYNAATPFILPTAFFVGGTNTLGFKWSNISGPGAFAVEFTNKTFSIGAVPEPGNIALLVGLGVPGSLFAVSSLRRRRNKAK
jgi:hypothetical protein